MLYFKKGKKRKKRGLEKRKLILLTIHNHIINLIIPKNYEKLFLKNAEMVNKCWKIA